MKTFEIKITVYVKSATARDALSHLAGTLDPICDGVNPMLAVSYPDDNDIQEEKEGACT